jgi:hypothetical protein
VLNELKSSFFNSDLEIFPEILGAVSKEQGELFCQEYQGRWNVNIMGDYCWTLYREIPETSHKGRATYAASLAREKDSTRPLNKI